MNEYLAAGRRALALALWQVAPEIPQHRIERVTDDVVRVLAEHEIVIVPASTWRNGAA